MLTQLLSEFNNLANEEKAACSSLFFKTGPGQYGEGDLFLGIPVPNQRTIVKKYWKNLSLSDVQDLLDSKYHEHRLSSLFVLIEMFTKSDESKRKEIFEFYLKNATKVNNWDLVDSSAPYIVGEYLLDKTNERDVLYDLVKSSNLWERRISIVATWQFIRNGQLTDTLKISELLLPDTHDLIHKAVGWMLREVGKRDEGLLVEFVEKHGKRMPRTALRYAIEKFSKERKTYFMKR
jgi:3-methyladenine DNA glycosylase AlkD